VEEMKVRRARQRRVLESAALLVGVVERLRRAADFRRRVTKETTGELGMEEFRVAVKLKYPLQTHWRRSMESPTVGLKVRVKTETRVRARVVRAVLYKDLVSSGE
jgi:hypothetical protein